MKKLSLILRYVSSTLVVLVALVFTVLEATLLVTLDFTLYENQFPAFVQLFLKLLIASSALTLGIFSLIKRNRCFVTYSLCLLISSALMIPFVSNGVAVYVTLVFALFAFSQIFSLKVQN